MTRIATVAILVLVGLAADGGEIAFTRKPEVKTANGGATVSFSINRATDVAVYVLDAKGEVIRHLAAGGLDGKNPPPAPLKPGLSQRLEWDGKDDAGKPAAGGPFKVRVRLGLKPEFDRTIGHAPGCVVGGMSMNRIAGIGVGRDGTLYVISKLIGYGTGSSHASIKAFDRTGKYLRMVAPYPANLPEEKLKGIKRIEIASGRRVPFVYNAETRALVPGLGETGLHRLVVTPDGRIIFRGSMGIARDRKSRYSQLVSVNTDGSIPAKGLLGPRTGSPNLAVSPDGKTLYATGKDSVVALKWNGGKSTTVIGSGLAGPRSLAVDGEGNLYVAESGAGKISVFKPDGSALGAIKVSRPVSVAVHPKTGGVYVLGGAKSNELSKFASWKSTTAAAKTTLPAGKGKPRSGILALDASGAPPVLWVATDKSILRIEDKGSAFSKPSGLRDNRTSVKANDLFVFKGQLHVYSQRGYAGPWVFDARTGKPVRRKLPKTEPYVGFILQGGADGKYYTLNSGGILRRYNTQSKPQLLPFTAAGKDGAIRGLGHTRTRARGMDIDEHGNIYVLRQKLPAEKTGDANAVAKIGPDGKMINKSLIDSDIRSLNSVRVDPAGNIYIELGARVGGKMIPPHLKGQVPATAEDPDAEAGHNYYPLMYGSIVKFGPDGGEIRKKGDGLPAAFGYKRQVSIKGAKWSFFGASLVPTFTHGGMTPDICACESPRFDVDGFGRSFFGDACGFRVGVLDSAGNLICWFGDYGNQDSAGPKSAIPEPEIPFGWVNAVAVDDEAAYIGDRLNQRVVKVKLGCSVEETCEVK